jgi:hypothetical protein
MNNNEEVCLYDGFKIRNYEPSYFDYIVEHAHEYNLILTYRIDTKDFALPISSTTGCTISQANQKNGFKISLKMVCKNNQMKRCVEISGSFHKFYNDWFHNADDFLIFCFKISFQNFVEYFNLPTETSEVCNLEVGLNLIPPNNFKARDLCNLLLFFKGKSIAEIETRMNRNTKGFSFYSENSNGKKKIYSKSDQYKTFNNGNEIIRIEVKLIKRREIVRALGIKNLDDLLDLAVHEKAIQYYLKNTRGLLFYQKEIEDLIPNEKSNQFHKYSDPDYWESLWKKDKEAFYLNKKNYFDLVNTYATQNISEYIVNEMHRKTKHV